MIKSACGRDECLDGDITIYFKNLSLRYLREDYVHCLDCHPDSNSSASPLAGEEEISQEEYLKLLEEGWREFNPV